MYFVKKQSTIMLIYLLYASGSAILPKQGYAYLTKHSLI